MPIPTDLLEILACPKCKGGLNYEAARNTLTCRACRLAYDVEKDVPILLIEKARPLA